MTKIKLSSEHMASNLAEAFPIVVGCGAQITPLRLQYNNWSENKIFGVGKLLFDDVVFNGRGT